MGERDSDGNDYWDDCENELVPCTCLKECHHICRGECGCKACRLAYQDFLSNE